MVSTSTISAQREKRQHFPHDRAQPDLAHARDDEQQQADGRMHQADHQVQHHHRAELNRVDADLRAERDQQRQEDDHGGQRLDDAADQQQERH